MDQKCKFLKRPLYLQVRDELANRIADGIWKAGASIPNEFELSNELGVSLGTVRKALDLMESEKILSRQQGRGTFVIDHNTGIMAARFSAFVDNEKQKLDEQIYVLKSMVDSPCAEVLEHLDASPSDDIYRCQRLHTCNQHPFMWEESVIVLRRWPNLRQNVGYERITTLAQENGIILSHATESVHPIIADEAMCSQLGVERNAPILRLDRTVYSDRGVRLEWRNAYATVRNIAYACNLT